VIGLWLLYEDEVEAGPRADRAVAALARRAAFKGERHRVVLLPDAHGGSRRRSAVSVSARAHCRCGMRRASPSACRRALYFAQSFSTAEATQISWGSPTRRIASSATSASSPSAARASSRPRARIAPTSRRPPSRSRWRAIGSIRRRRFRAGRTCGGRESARPAPLGELCRMGRRGSAARQFSRNSRGWTRERGGAAAVELRWPARTDAALPKLVLVGKGVCFDSGGLDIKTSAAWRS
jgi:hypothetical protein